MEGGLAPNESGAAQSCRAGKETPRFVNLIHVDGNEVNGRSERALFSF